jgi:hypothetical protein
MRGAAKILKQRKGEGRDPPSSTGTSTHVRDDESSWVSPSKGTSGRQTRALGLTEMAYEGPFPWLVLMLASVFNYVNNKDDTSWHQSRENAPNTAR